MSQPMRVCIIGSGNWYVTVCCIKIVCSIVLSLLGVILKFRSLHGRLFANTCFATQDRYH